MPRRSSKKADIEVLKFESTETTVTPKKGRKAVKIETTEVVAKIEQISPAKSNEAKVEVGSDDEPLTTPKKSSEKPKINSVKSKAILEEAQIPKQKKASSKRKAKTEEEDDDDTEEKKVPKKRKTKEEKEAEAMPLAARTLIGSLKKAIHIGAHVSSAGGESSSAFSKKRVGT
jgi:AP endonuclease-1